MIPAKGVPELHNCNSEDRKLLAKLIPSDKYLNVAYRFIRAAS